MSLPQWQENTKLKVVCRDCTAECCKHIGVPIDPPKSWSDFQAIKHYIAHEGVNCYLDVEGDWVVEFITKCGQLNGNQCSAWGTTAYPRICKEYDMETCVMNEEGEWWEILFKTPEDVDRYCESQGLNGEPQSSAPPCVSVPIDTPEDLGDFDDLRWYVAHRDVIVYRQGTQWYVHFNSMCKPICSFKASHIPTEYELILRNWEDIAIYLKNHPETPPASPVEAQLT
jgi:uncharacterized protein